VTALYVVSLMAGLVLAVRSMLTGVEKPRHGNLLMPPDEQLPPLVRIRTPTLGAFGVAFGVVGYLLERVDATGSAMLHLLAASVAGAVAVALVLLMLTTWAKPALAEATEDPRYVLQGIPARVTRAMSSGSAGEIVYEVDGREMMSPALDFEGGDHAVGDEVVIDRIEDGVAYVESWSLVEQRL
jgi:hypothetical protein